MCRVVILAHNTAIYAIVLITSNPNPLKTIFIIVTKPDCHLRKSTK